MRVDEVQILLDQGRIALNQGRFEEASELIDRVIVEDEHNEQALNLRGLLFFKQDRFTEAVDLFGDLVKKYPEEPTLLMNLGLAYLKSEQYEPAIVDLNRALEKMPGNPKILNYLGLAYSGIGRLKEAQDYFLKGGSTKMADQMLQMMMEKSGEAEELEVEVDSLKGAVAETPIEDITIEPEIEVLEDESTADVQSEPQPEAPVQQDPPEAQVEADVEEISIDVVGNDVLAGDDQEIAPTDLLGSAMSLLKDRYEMVLETAAAGKDLNELSQMLELSKDSTAHIDHVQSNLIRVSVMQEGTTLARMSGVLGLAGDVRAEPRHKRYKGKDIKSTFGGEADPVYELVGAGTAYLRCEGGKTFFPLTLSGELLYVVEDSFYAASGEWRWENGRLPGKNGNDLHLVQLRGNGTLAIVLDTQEKLGAIQLKGQKLTLPVSALAGWFGNIVPVLVDLTFPAREGATGAVQFQGDGTVLLRVPGDV